MQMPGLSCNQAFYTWTANVRSMDVEKLLEKLPGLERCSRCDRDCCRNAHSNIDDIKRVMPRAERLWKEGRLKVKGAGRGRRPGDKLIGGIEGELRVSDLFELYKAGKDDVRMRTRMRDISWRECGFKDCFKEEIDPFRRCVFLDLDGRCVLYPYPPLACRLYGFADIGIWVTIGGCERFVDSEEAKEESIAYVRKHGRKLEKVFAIELEESMKSRRFIKACLGDERFLLQSIGTRKATVRDLHETDLIDYILKAASGPLPTWPI